MNRVEKLSRLPAHSLFISAYFVLALLANNITEVDPAVAVRPLLFSVAAAFVILLIFSLAARSWRKAAVLATLAIVLFFTYGHIYGAVRNAAVLGFIVGRHRYLIPIIGTIFLAAGALVLRSKASFVRPTQTLNLVALVLLVFPIIGLADYVWAVRGGQIRAESVARNDADLILRSTGSMPDIYYIILDGYTRSDALERDFGFDNSFFIEALRGRGFYVADCSRTNYTTTRPALATALNMDYLDRLEGSSQDEEFGDPELEVLLRDSRVRRLVEEFGYQTVAFKTDYSWSSIRDADIYLSMDTNPLTLQQLDPFESLLVDSTAIRAAVDLELRSFASRTKAIDDFVRISQFKHAARVERQLFILDQLPDVAKLSDPTFTIAHLTTTHTPYLFDHNGNIWEDEGFYGTELNDPVDEWHWIVGYTEAIKFTNSRILEIIDLILENSIEPPIILIQGDHGLRGDNRHQILNAYYLQDGDPSRLYSSISPVNTFRTIFDLYFGTDLGLVEDLSYREDFQVPVAETSEFCLDRSTTN